MTMNETACEELVQVSYLGRRVCSFDGVEMYSADVNVTSKLKELDIWTDKDLGYINRSGFQAFGVDYYIKDELLCKRYESDYNVFIVIGSKGREWDMAEISMWENIFWPTAYDTLCEKLRSKVGTVAIEFFGDDTVHIYTKDFILVVSDVGRLQLAMLALVKFYDSDFNYSVFSEETRNSIDWDPHGDYDIVYDCLPEYRKTADTTKELAVERFWRNML